jgi:hypothetical protein
MIFLTDRGWNACIVFSERTYTVLATVYDGISIRLLEDSRIECIGFLVFSKPSIIRKTQECRDMLHELSSSQDERC